MTDVHVPADRLPRWMRSGGGGSLPLERARSRLAAYVYGTILVLAAVAVQTRETIADGHAAIAVAATTVTTLLAHLVAHAVAQQLGRGPGSLRLHLREELRDIVPIVSAGVVPVAVVVLASTGALDTRLAQALAGGWLIVRLVLLAPAMRRMSGQPVTRRTIGLGVALAIVSTVVVALKATLLH